MGARSQTSGTRILGLGVSMFKTPKMEQPEEVQIDEARINRERSDRRLRRKGRLSTLFAGRRGSEDAGNVSYVGRETLG